MKNIDEMTLTDFLSFKEIFFFITCPIIFYCPIVQRCEAGEFPDRSNEYEEGQVHLHRRLRAGQGVY